MTAIYISIYLLFDVNTHSKLPTTVSSSQLRWIMCLAAGVSVRVSRFSGSLSKPFSSVLLHLLGGRSREDKFMTQIGIIIFMYYTAVVSRACFYCPLHLTTHLTSR